MKNQIAIPEPCISVDPFLSADCAVYQNRILRIANTITTPIPQMTSFL
jgi:hypothetical protein